MALKVVYPPKGRAREYADLALNHYKGCTHGCLYCYAPASLWRDRADFHASDAPRKDVLKNLALDAPLLTDREVLLSFACDPYCPGEAKHRLTREIVRTLHKHGVGVNILTKGTGALEDLDQFTAHPELSRIGATLTVWNSKEWEPNAPEVAQRIAMLTRFKAHGIRTWASMEPVLDPDEALDIMEFSASVVDHYKVGMWNHDARAKLIDWASFLDRAEALLQRLGKSYYIKKDLQAAAGKALA